jgi:hypothetical protein
MTTSNVFNAVPGVSNIFAQPAFVESPEIRGVFNAHISTIDYRLFSIEHHFDFISWANWSGVAISLSCFSNLLSIAKNPTHIQKPIFQSDHNRYDGSFSAHGLTLLGLLGIIGVAAPVVLFNRRIA